MFQDQIINECIACDWHPFGLCRDCAKDGRYPEIDNAELWFDVSQEIQERVSANFERGIQALTEERAERWNRRAAVYQAQFGREYRGESPWL